MNSRVPWRGGGKIDSRSMHQFKDSPLVRLTRNSEARSPSPDRKLGISRSNSKLMLGGSAFRGNLVMSSARPDYGRPPSEAGSQAPSMRSAKNDDGVSESTKVMRYLKAKQIAEEPHGAPPPLWGKTEKEKKAEAEGLMTPALVDFRRAGLKSTGLLNECHTVFTLADADTNGTLDMDELKMMQQCLKNIHPDLYPAPLTPAIADEVVGNALDTDGDGVISRAEWVAFITKQAHQNGERPMLKLMQVLAKQLATMWR